LESTRKLLNPLEGLQSIATLCPTSIVGQARSIWKYYYSSVFHAGFSGNIPSIPVGVLLDRFITKGEEKYFEISEDPTIKARNDHRIPSRRRVMASVIRDGRGSRRATETK
jgi:hypothetical protein